jgi:outer membrane protein TolC
VQASRSGYLPRVDIQGGYTAQKDPQSISTPFGSFETQEADYGFLSLGITQTLYDFGRTSARYGRAQATSEATRFDYKKQEQNVFLQTVTSYFLILQGQKLLKAADEEITQMTDHLRVAKVLFEEGVVTRNNLLQAEVRLASSRQRRLEIANRLDNAWLDFNNQIGDPPESRKELVEDTTITLSGLDKPAQEAVAGRAEILAQRKLLDANELEVKENKSGYLPELYAKAGLDYVQNDKVKEQYIMAATVGLKINLFDGFATTAHLNQAVKNRSRTEERLRQMETDFALEYRTAVNDANVARQRISVTEASIKQGEENLRINKDRYQEQVGSATEVIDAQTLLTQIRTENYQAIFDYQIALAKVKRARGEL